LPDIGRSGVAFLDRDGTINEKAPEGKYIANPREVKLLPGAARAIRRLNDASIHAIVVTNQRGVALGRMTQNDLDAVNAELARQLSAAAGAHIDALFSCPHDVGECECRKPATGMFRQARERYPWITFETSAMIGDSASDVEAGQALCMTTVQLGVDVPDLEAAVDALLPATAPADFRLPTGRSQG
jgi:D-glycero-D-manno-heptose 1,7-bisphosphate phosphatase